MHMTPYWRTDQVGNLQSSQIRLLVDELYREAWRSLPITAAVADTPKYHPELRILSVAPPLYEKMQLRFGLSTVA